MDVSLDELGAAYPERLTQQFRAEVPTLLIYRFRELPWVGVAKCAPLDYMLWGTESSSAKQVASERRWSAALVDDSDVYSAFLRELRRARIRVGQVPWELLGPYCHSGVLGGQPSRLRPASLGMRYRVIGSVVPAPLLDDLIDYYARELTQFGCFAFWRSTEGEENSLAAQERSASSDVRESGYLGSRLWHHPLPAYLHGPYDDESDRLDALSALRRELAEAVEHLETETEWELPLDFEGAIRAFPYFFCKGFIRPTTDLSRASAEEAFMEKLLGHDRPPCPETPLDAEVYGYRARVVRLLGWPSMYRSLSTSWSGWQEMSELAGEQVFRDPCRFGMVDELIAFRREMEERYPVLLENPLDRLDAVPPTP